jgi:superfamily II DNA or RNA helicase
MASVMAEMLALIGSTAEGDAALKAQRSKATTTTTLKYRLTPDAAYQLALVKSRGTRTTFSFLLASGTTYELAVELPVALNGGEEALRATIAQHPENLFKITRQRNKRTNENTKTVQRLGKQFFDDAGRLLRIDVVFESAMRETAEFSTALQPEGVPWRLCLQLVEPTASPDAWHLRCLLQAIADPSLLLELDEAKSFTVVIGAYGRRSLRYDKPELTTQGKFDFAKYALVVEAATHRFPMLNRWYQPASWLAKGACDSIPLSLPEVVEFLESVAPEIERAGFGIRLPSWCAGGSEHRKLSLIARAREMLDAGTGLTLDKVIRFDWQVALGDDTLTADELAQIAALKVPLVQVRGKWVHFKADELLAIAKIVQQGPPEPKPIRELFRLSRTGGEVDGLPVARVEGNPEVETLLSRLADVRQIPDRAQPVSLRAELHSYQKRGFAWLSHMADLGLGACLADDMGLGKTIQTLALLQERWENGDREPNLLVCPFSVTPEWTDQAQRFSPDLPVLVHRGPDRSRDPQVFAKRVANEAIVLTNYALLSRDAELFRSVKWSGVILDEAQNVKNPDTEQAKAARSIPARFRIALTGTPVENNVRDLWSIMEFLNPGFLGAWPDFEKRFFAPIQRGRDADAMARLKRATSPFILRRLKADPEILPELPPKQETKVFCNLTPEQATLYQAALKSEEANLEASDAKTRRGLIFRLLAGLKQVCNHPVHYLKDRSSIPDRSGKLSRLTEKLEELRSTGEPECSLIFTQYRRMGDLLQAHLTEVFQEEILFLHGSLTADERNAIVKRFKAANGPRIFILTLKAGGSGLNLTRATHVFHYDRWWNPAVENQATDRAHRKGQVKHVQVHKLICMGTLEERIDQLIERKKEVTERVVGNVESWLAALSNDQLYEWLKLGDNAVAD